MGLCKPSTYSKIDGWRIGGIPILQIFIKINRKT